MNILNDAEILKALLPETSKSIYDLEKELKKKLGEGNVNYPTLLRYFNRLQKDGFINEARGTRKGGVEDKRETRKPSISNKGIVFLILNATLSKEEADTIMAKLLSEPQVRRYGLDLVAVKDMTSEALRKTFEDMKPKVNLEHYDEKYVQNLLNDALMDNLLDEVLAYLKKILPNEHLERYMKKKAKRSLSELSEPIKMALSVYEHEKSKRDFYTKKIEALKPYINVFKKVLKT